MSFARPFMHLAWIAAIAGVLFATWMATFAALFGIAPSAPRAPQANPLNGPIHILTER